jgi:hypothetical protein
VARLRMGAPGVAGLKTERTGIRYGSKSLFHERPWLFGAR